MQYIACLLIAMTPLASYALDIPCLDPLACNFMEEGECFFTDENGNPCVIEGCTIEGACNYDPEADIYDGSCEFVSCLGCTDSEACNYDETALYDDATCIYYVDCNGTCGGDWIEDACGNCFSLTNETLSHSITFSFNGQEQVFIVPENTFLIEVELGGASGYSTMTHQGGQGGIVRGILEVTPGQLLYIVVGGQGAACSEPYTIMGGGFNGGGHGIANSSTNTCGGGGGSTDIRLSYNSLSLDPLEPSSLSTRLVVAGGGGGSTQNSNCDGGSGGSEMGESVDCGYGIVHGGNQDYAGSAGGFGFGGSASESSTPWIGGGGGGWFGGGVPTEHGSGSGGSSFTSELLEVYQDSQGGSPGNGYCIITWEEPIIPFCNPGCTLSQACNYNPESNFDDGSCDYCFCLEGTQWSDSLQGCVSIPTSCVDACGPGTHWDEGIQACLPDITCAEDINLDGVIGTADLLQLLSNFGEPCANDEPNGYSCGEVISFNNYDYATVQIGEQCWFAENLRTELFANGDSIPGSLSNSEWISESSSARAVYGNDNANLATYGRLYNWYAVDDARGLCPSGWHVPTDSEWTTLRTTLEGPGVAGPKMKSSPCDTPSWDGTNESGFSALPGGKRDDYNGDFVDESIHGAWWSSSQHGASSAWSRSLYSENDDLYEYNYLNARNGLSVRCIQN